MPKQRDRAAIAASFADQPDDDDPAVAYRYEPAADDEMEAYSRAHSDFASGDTGPLIHILDAT